MGNQKFSSLGRPLDLSDHTNLAIILTTLMALVFSYLYLIYLAGFSWEEAILPSVGLGFGVFFSWAISREINPDFRYSAFISLALLIIMALYNENILRPDYLSLFWILFFQRLLNRSSGLKAKLFDSVLTLGLTIWLAFTYSWITGIIAAFVYWLDAMLASPQPGHRIFALLSLIIGIVSFILNPAFDPSIFNNVEWIALGILSVLFLGFIFMTKEIKSKADRTPQILDKQRIRFTQSFSLIALILFSIVNGIEAFYGLAALWCAMAGVFIHTLFMKSGKKTKYVEDGHETIVK